MRWSAGTVITAASNMLNVASTPVWWYRENKADATVNLTGVDAVGRIGNVDVSGGAVVTVTGVAAVGVTGSVTAAR